MISSPVCKSFSLTTLLGFLDFRICAASKARSFRPSWRFDAPMPDHPHTIDRWDDATGENLVEQIAAVGDYPGRGRDLSGGGEALAHAPESGAGDRAELEGLGGRSRLGSLCQSAEQFRVHLKHLYS